MRSGEVIPLPQFFLRHFLLSILVIQKQLEVLLGGLGPGCIQNLGDIRTVKRCILSFGDGQKFSSIYRGVFVCYVGSYPPNTYCIKFENCVEVKLFGRVEMDT